MWCGLLLRVPNIGYHRMFTHSKVALLVLDDICSILSDGLRVGSVASGARELCSEGWYRLRMD